MKKLVLALALLTTSAATAPLLTSCNTEPSYVKQARKVEEEQKKRDDATIQAYLGRNSITNYTRLESGIYLVPITDGDTGNPLITPGKKVTTKYVGKFVDEINENQVFDASSNNRTTCGCFSFINGQNGIITGWSLATQSMRLGDRKLILIPSYLAYGAAGSGPILANSPLLFDMEITNVE